MIDYSEYLHWIDSRHDRMVELVRSWAEINSGTRNLPGLARMLSALEKEFSTLHARTSRKVLPAESIVTDDGDMAHIALGRALSLRKRPGAAHRVFLGIHYDTVYGEENPFQHCTQIDSKRLKGPGVADAKGGLVVMLTALQALERSPWAENVGWEVLINPDEEVGSPGSAPLLIEAAARNEIGLVYEPSLPDGTLVGARKGSGNFHLVFRGKQAHAGRNPEDGKNAIEALGKFIVDMLDAVNDYMGITVNLGRIGGGGPLNVVPDLAILRFNVRASSLEDQRSFEGLVKDLVGRYSTSPDARVELHGGFGRAPKPMTGSTLQLADELERCGTQLNIPIRWRSSGGASDGNILVAAGLPTVDSLGVRGGDIHSANEYVLLDSLTERAKLTALLLMRIGSGETKLVL